MKNNKSLAWIKGFSRAINVFTNVDAELWTLREGLLMCRNLNLVAMEIELDAKLVIGWIFEEYNSNLQHAALILDCRTLISHIPQVRMSHCFREANKCANALARKGPELDQNIVYFDSMLMNLNMLLFL